MFYFVLGKNICYWAYFHCSKWPNIGSQLVTLNIFNAYFCVLKMCTTLPTKKMKTKNMPERTKIGRKEPNSYNGHLSYFIFVTGASKSANILDSDLMTVTKLFFLASFSSFFARLGDKKYIESFFFQSISSLHKTHKTNTINFSIKYSKISGWKCFLPKNTFLVEQSSWYSPMPPFLAVLMQPYLGHKRMLHPLVCYHTFAASICCIHQYASITWPQVYAASISMLP